MSAFCLSAGYGYGIDVLTKRFLKGSSKDFRMYISAAFSVVFFIIIINYTAYDKLRLPPQSKEVYAASLIELKEKLPEDASVFTWWDDGYMIQNITGLPTYHDGGIMETAKTFLRQKALFQKARVKCTA